MIINPVPLRLQILIALTETIKTVTPANGFQFDLSDDADGERHVVRGRLQIGDSDPRTLVSLLEPPTTVEAILTRSPENTQRAGEWDVLVQGWVKNDRDNDECDLAYLLAAEVQQVLSVQKTKRISGRPGALNVLGLGERVIEMKIGAPVIRPTEEVTDYGVFYLILTLKIVEDTALPFG